MKKLLVLNLLLFLTLSTVSCTENDDVNYQEQSKVNSLMSRSTEDTEMLETFNDYLYQNEYIDEDFGRIVLEQSYVQMVDSAKVLALIVRHDDYDGIIYGLKTSQTGQLRLPNNDEYFIIFDKYSNVDTINDSGTRERYDLNYGHFLFQELEIDQGTIIKQVVTPVPTITVTSNGTTPSSCSGGSNGDLSWGECMNCVSTVCSNDPQCNNICDAIDTIQEYNPTFLGVIDCGVMMGIGCVAAAIAY